MPSDPLAWIDDALTDLEESELRRTLRVRDGAMSDSILIDDTRLINFGSNDYLGLATDERLSRAAVAETNRAGWGSGASPLISGRESLHARLERELASFEGTEAALLFSSGFAANMGTISSLVGRGDVVLSDAKNHASIIDGCRLSRAEVQIYRHNDVDHLSKLLRAANSFRRRLVVTDSLFSMDGDLAPLVQIVEVTERYNAMLMVDEAHATGVFGENGRGVAEHLGVEDGVHVRIGTLSKALGSIGGFAAGPRNLIDWLSNRARPYVFSTASPSAVCSAGIAALEIVSTEPFRRTELLSRATYLRDQLLQRGYNIGASVSHIVPVVLGDPKQTMQACQSLRQHGFFVPGIRPPTVPQGESLLRISLSYSHSDQMICDLIDKISFVLQ